MILNIPLWLKSRLALWCRTLPGKWLLPHAPPVTHSNFELYPRSTDLLNAMLVFCLSLLNLIISIMSSVKVPVISGIINDQTILNKLVLCPPDQCASLCHIPWPPQVSLSFSHQGYENQLKEIIPSCTSVFFHCWFPDFIKSEESNR